MAEFILTLLLAVIGNRVDIEQASSYTSVDTVPQVSTQIYWDCGEETCWIIFDAAGAHTGP